MDCDLNQRLDYLATVTLVYLGIHIHSIGRVYYAKLYNSTKKLWKLMFEHTPTEVARSAILIFCFLHNPVARMFCPIMIDHNKICHILFHPSYGKKSLFVYGMPFRKLSLLGK